MTLDTKPYKGARDFYPEDKKLQNYIFSVWREVAQSFGYEEYDAPIIEPIELYKTKTSEEIVNEQTFAFEDRAGRQVTIRPEMTPSVSRMIAARRQNLAYPVRWFSIPNLWRYERPQRGRLREHWQLNVDLFGVAGLAGDHEIIVLADAIMHSFKAKSNMFTIKINSRVLVDHILSEYAGLTKNQVAMVVRLIDRIHKIAQGEFEKALAEAVGDKADTLIQIFNAQSSESNGLPKELQQHSSYSKLHKLKVMLARCGITNVQFDISLMRGFDYYTDIVFEIFDNDPENNRSLFGGGRYDGLVGQFGVEPIPTVGFGMGDVTIKDFLQAHKLLPKTEASADLVVILIGDVYMAAQEAIKTLRDGGLKVAVDSTERKLDKQIKSATKAGFEWAMFVGEQEIASNRYNLKNLLTGQEQQLSIAEINKLLVTEK